MKKILFIMLVVLFSTLSYAEETDLVRVMKLYYKDGDVDIIDSILKLGYSPDRNIQPENGYRLEIIALTDETLYEFIFEPPTKIFTDVSDDYGNLSGGIIFLDETYFALIIPNFENEKEIKIYNRDGELMTTQFVFKEPVLSPKAGASYTILLIVLIILSIFLWRRKHKENPIVRETYSGWK